jgi:hypothetical protein
VFAEALQQFAEALQEFAEVRMIIVAVRIKQEKYSQALQSARFPQFVRIASQISLTGMLGGSGS